MTVLLMFKRKLAQLEQEIAARRAAEDRDGEVAARAKKALLHLLSFNIQAVFGELAKIMTLTSGQESDYTELAQTFYVQGKQLARHPGQRQAAQELFFKAASVFHTLEDRLGEAESLRAWAQLDIAEGDFQSALKHLDKAIALFDDDSNELELLVELYRLRTNCHAHQGNAEPAWADMDKALVLAHRSGDRVFIRQVQSERQALSELLATDEATE
jgi:tetratricopeptide (TPR) repeat protein